MAKRADLTDEEYKFVEEIGQVHYSASILNSSSALPAD